jgi:hypothetical protein
MLSYFNKFLEWKYLVLFLCLFCASQVFVSYWSHDSSWFSASGAVVGIFRILLTVKHSVLKTSIDVKLGKQSPTNSMSFSEEDELTEEFGLAQNRDYVIQSKLEKMAFYCQSLEL